MASLAHSTRPVTTSPRTPAHAPPHVVSALLWHALLKVADKEAVRTDLPAGSTSLIDLSVTGTIDGEPIDEPILGILSVGTDSTRATSQTPSLNAVVAYILSRLNEATRESLLRGVPEAFGRGEIDDTPEAIVEKTAAMLVRLRAKKTVDVAGPVSFKPAAIALAILPR